MSWEPGAWLVLPVLLLVFAAWLVGGLALARVGLRLQGRLEAAVLALPLGLTLQVLAANALGRVVPLPAAIALAHLAALGAGAWALARHGTPMDWELGTRPRAWLTLAAVGLGLGVLWIAVRGIFVDDGAHASMAQLLAAGQFPLRFQCDPGLRASYHYGGDLLAAALIVLTGCSPWQAVALAKAAAVTSVAQLAFLAGWRWRRSVAAGLLSAGLLVTVGPMFWIYLPLAHGGLAEHATAQPALAPLVESIKTFAQDPWKYSVWAPGGITPQYPHTHRSLAWALAPFPVLLFLALWEGRMPARRKTVALGVVLGSTALIQSAALLILLPSVVAYLVLMRWRPAPAAPPRDWSLAGALALALLLALAQGGPITDSLLDRLEGLTNPTTGFQLTALRLPSCRDSPPTLACLLLSLANLGLAPLLLPWLACWLWRTGQAARLGLALGCAFSYVVPAFVRYDYIDWNLQRLPTFASWTLAALLAPPLLERLRAGGRGRALAAAAVFALGCTGLMQAVVVADGRRLRDEVTTEYFGIGPNDEALRPYGQALPRTALVFDPAGCQRSTACRSAILFGRYTAAARDRVRFLEPSPAFRVLRKDPQARKLRRHGYTHLYLDGQWLEDLAPRARAQLDGGPFEVLGLAGTHGELRALLRICQTDEGCVLRLPVGAGSR